MIKLKTLGFSIFGVSATWEMTGQNKEIARKIIVFLEDRKLLFGERGKHPYDEEYCRLSAQQIREFLGEQLQDGKPGKVLTQATVSEKCEGHAGTL